MQFSTLLETAASFGDSTLTVRAGNDAPSTRGFPELVADVRRLQAALASAGLERGCVVGLQACNRYEFVVWDLALIELGAVAHVFPEQWSIEEMQKAARQFQLAASISHRLGNLRLADGPGAPPELPGLASCERSRDPDLLTRVYSSGSSGYLKGLVIGRAGVEDVATLFAEDFHVTAQDRHLFFLTMTHFQQRLTVYTCLAAGVSLMITPAMHVLHDLPRFKPTFFVAPPLFYEMTLAALVPHGAEANGAGRMRAVFGEQFRFLITGMAPIRREILDSYRRFGIPLLEAYGMTEVGLISWNMPDDNVPGTVGRPLRTHRILIGDEGEIRVKAPHPFAKRYFDVSEQESARTFVGDGVIATGDIGRMEGSHLVLLGRKKDIIVTSDGHKLHPSMIEARILACPAILQVYVVTDPRKGDIVAVVSTGNPADPASAEAIRLAIAAANEGVRPAARIARTIVTELRFTPENGLLTPTLKPDRQAIVRKFLAGAP